MDLAGGADLPKETPTSTSTYFVLRTYGVLVGTLLLAGVGSNGGLRSRTRLANGFGVGTGAARYE